MSWIDNTLEQRIYQLLALGAEIHILPRQGEQDAMLRIALLGMTGEGLISTSIGAALQEAAMDWRGYWDGGPENSSDDESAQEKE